MIKLTRSMPSRAIAPCFRSQSGKRAGARCALLFLWSAVAAGLSMGASLVAGIFSRQAGGFPVVFTRRPDTFGFIDYGSPAAVHGKPVTAPYYPVIMQSQAGKHRVLLLLRLWSVVLIGNLIEFCGAAWAFNYNACFDDADPRRVPEDRRVKGDENAV